MTQQTRMARTPGSFPVDNATYNLLQALVSKLEAIEAYEQYRNDDGGQIFDQLVDQERSQAEQLLGELQDRIGSSSIIGSRTR